MIDDPSAEFRRLAVQQLIDAAGKADEAQRKQLHRQVFQAALDPDQLDLAFDELSKAGEKPDLKRAWDCSATGGSSGRLIIATALVSMPSTPGNGS